VPHLELEVMGTMVTRPLTPLWAFMACYRGSFTFLYPVTEGHKYRDLVLQAGSWTRG
jgi:hypothetical protein